MAPRWTGSARRLDEITATPATLTETNSPAVKINVVSVLGERIMKTPAPVSEDTKVAAPKRGREKSSATKNKVLKREIYISSHRGGRRGLRL